MLLIYLLKIDGRYSDCYNYFINITDKATHADFRVLCENKDKTCRLSWSTIGQGMTSKNKTSLWIKDAVDVFLQFDNLFGKKYRSITKSFSLFGLFDGKSDVLFHDSTVKLNNKPTVKNMESMTGFYDSILDNIDKCVISSTAIIKYDLILLVISLLLQISIFYY